MIKLQDIAPGTVIFMSQVEGGVPTFDMYPSKVISATENYIKVHDVEFGEDYDYDLREDGLLHQHQNSDTVNPWVLFFDSKEAL